MENPTAMVKEIPPRMEMSLAWPGPIVGNPINGKIKLLGFKSNLKNKIQLPTRKSPQNHQEQLLYGAMLLAHTAKCQGLITAMETQV